MRERKSIDSSVEFGGRQTSPWRVAAVVAAVCAGVPAGLIGLSTGSVTNTSSCAVLSEPPPRVDLQALQKLPTDGEMRATTAGSYGPPFRHGLVVADGGILPPDDPCIFSDTPCPGQASDGNSSSNTSRSPSVSAQSSSSTSEVKEFKAAEAEQQLPYWCWAACIQMLLKHHKIEWTQSQVTASVNGGVPIFSTGSKQQICQAFNKWSFTQTGARWKGSCTYQPGPLNADSVLFSFQLNNNPVILAYEDHHVVMLHSITYHSDGFSGHVIDSIEYYDPFDGIEKNVNWATDWSHFTGAFYVVVLRSDVVGQGGTTF